MTELDQRYRLFLTNESHALLTRLSQLQPFETSSPMVISAAIPLEARRGIYELMQKGKGMLRRRVRNFIRHLKTDSYTSIEQCQQMYSLLKLQFNALLDQFAIFSDVISQRSEHNTGIWVAGLDALAKDALHVDHQQYKPPPVICYLDRGHGAAIRRAGTRLPGGESNPVAVIKIPRERMVASGIGSSLVHEAGHQVSVLLDLIASIKPMLEERAEADEVYAHEWLLLSRWISEILSDMWAVSMLGISATTGLVSVVSLPRYFVFRAVDDDPHPFPWIRVKLSLAFGKVLYPDEQWHRLERLWETMYPLQGLQQQMAALIERLEHIIPDFVRSVLEHQPQRLQGRMLHNIFPLQLRQPAQLRNIYQQWQADMEQMKNQRPTMVFAVVGQARADNTISPKAENRLLSSMLRHWAIMNT